MRLHRVSALSLFFFNDTATTEIYTLSLHDALPIWVPANPKVEPAEAIGLKTVYGLGEKERSEEHTSELQSLAYLVCRLLLEKKKKKPLSKTHTTQTSQHKHSLP